MPQSQKKKNTRRQRRRQSKNAYRKWKRSILQAADTVISELIRIVEQPSEISLPSDG
jgi:hypothetical protein